MKLFKKIFRHHVSFKRILNLIKALRIAFVPRTKQKSQMIFRGWFLMESNRSNQSCLTMIDYSMQSCFLMSKRDNSVLYLINHSLQSCLLMSCHRDITLYCISAFFMIDQSKVVSSCQEEIILHYIPAMLMIDHTELSPHVKER